MRNPKLETNDFLVFVIAPQGRDAVLICDLLGRAEIACRMSGSAEAAFREMADGLGAVIVADEALTPPRIEAFVQLVETQPPWSDFPLIIVTHGGAVSTSTEHVRKMLEPLGSVLLLERPIRPETLVSMTQIALRGRRRQYQIRDHEEALRRDEAHLRLIEERLRLAHKAANIGTWELNLDTEEYVWSDEVHEILGTAHSGLPPNQKDLLSLMYFSTDRENAEKALRHAITRNKEYETQFRILRADGK